MLLIDAHLDLAMNALQGNRDLTRSVYTIRATENKNRGKGQGQGTVAFPEMRQGRVALGFATAIARSTGRPRPPTSTTITRPRLAPWPRDIWPTTGRWKIWVLCAIITTRAQLGRPLE